MKLFLLKIANKFRVPFLAGGAGEAELNQMLGVVKDILNGVLIGLTSIAVIVVAIKFIAKLMASRKADAEAQEIAENKEKAKGLLITLILIAAVGYGLTGIWNLIYPWIVQSIGA